MQVYIQSAKQISVQKPLSDEWFERPVYYDGKRVPTIDPPFGDYLSPSVSRRLCTLLRRAVVLSRLTLQDAGIDMPDAIISGTGLGCIDNTENFLLSMIENGEQCLQPTYFMQSTHNIISSTVAIDLKCHGYNNTYVHRGASFEHALLDALMQFGQKRVKTALVGGYDELTDNYYTLFGRMGTWNFNIGERPEEKCFAAEASACMALGAEKKTGSLCELNDVALLYRPSYENMRATLDRIFAAAGCSMQDIDAVFVGMNTNNVNDDIYRRIAEKVFDGRPLVRYKHLFGESFSSSALAVYAAATCLRNGRIPASLVICGNNDLNPVKRILVYNHYRNKSHSFILLSSCLN